MTRLLISTVTVQYNTLNILVTNNNIIYDAKVRYDAKVSFL